MKCLWSQKTRRKLFWQATTQSSLAHYWFLGLVPRNTQRYSELSTLLVTLWISHPENAQAQHCSLWFSDVLIRLWEDSCPLVLLHFRHNTTIWKSTAFRVRFFCFPTLLYSSLAPPLTANTRCVSCDLAKTPEHSLEKAERKNILSVLEKQLFLGLLF